MERKCLVISLVTTLLTQVECFWMTMCPRECLCKDGISLTSPRQRFTENGKIFLDSLTKFHQQRDPTVKIASCSVHQETSFALMFKKLPEDLQVLIIVQGEFSKPVTVHDKIFRNLQSLASLEIHGMSKGNVKLLTVLPDSFHNLRKLQFLHLQNVNITQIESLPFNKLSGLKILRLIQNNLHYLPVNIFQGMHMLEEIILDSNHLRIIPSTVFAGALNLRQLHIKNNQLHCFDNCIGNQSLAKLEILDLSGNNITQLSSVSFLPMPHLMSLNLKDNPIQVLFPYSFPGFPRLEKLLLGHHRQPLQILPFTFQGLSAVTSLEIPNVDNNVIQNGMFDGLSNVQQLSLHGKIQQITNNAFSGATQIVHLSLRSCRLRKISRNALSGLKNLQSLDMSNNRLAKLNAQIFSHTKALSELQLQNNQLQELPKRIFNIMALKSLRLEGNPWNCTCDIAKWKEFAVARVRKQTGACTFGTQVSKNDAFSLPICQDKEIKYVKDNTLIPVCNIPQQYLGQSVFDVVKKQLKCYKKKKH